MLTYLDVAGSDQRRFPIEVARVYDVVVRRIEDELGQVHLPLVEGIQKG